MSSIGNLTRIISFVALATAMSVSCVFANTLSEIEINSQDGGYGIVFKSDSVAEMKKIVSGEDKMSIELKDVELATDFNTVYNNVVDIDNVTISPTSKNDIKVVFKGRDVANSKISFSSSKSNVLQPISATQSIELSAPISSYTPVYSPEKFVEETVASQTSNPQINEILTKMHITREMLIVAKKYVKGLVNKFNSSDLNMMTIVGMIVIALAFMLRPVRKQNSEKKYSLTGIVSQERNSNIEREIGINRKLTSNMNLKQSNPINTSVVNSGYGVRAYQQSQRNPYTTAMQSSNGVSGIARRKPLQASTPIKKQTTVNKPLTTKTAVPIKSKSPSMMNSSVKKNVVAPQAEMDSVKFLESITKIYEKNGRADLAKGLQDNLKKAQMSQHIAV